MVTEETDVGYPFVVMENWFAAGYFVPVASNVSLKDNVSVVPAVVVVTAVFVGGVRSTVELLVMTTPEKASMLPLALPMIAQSVPFGSQLAVTTAPAGMVGAQPERDVYAV
jgi:hypothetical protein